MAGGGAIVGVKEEKIDVGGVVEFHRTEFAECDHAELGIGDASAFVDLPRRAVAIVEILYGQAECVIENRVGEV
jgi:hypothetical protein